MYHVYATGWGLVGTYATKDEALAYARQDAAEYRRIHEVTDATGRVLHRIEPRRY